MFGKVLTAVIATFILVFSTTAFAADAWVYNHPDGDGAYYVDTDSIAVIPGMSASRNRAGDRPTVVKFVVKVTTRKNPEGREKVWNVWTYQVYTRADDPYNYYVAGKEKGIHANEFSAIPKSNWHMDAVMKVVAKYNKSAASMLP